jgi:superfamily II DNA or RNA helicase
VCATGLGKTEIGCWTIEDWAAQQEGDILWLAHREELIRDAATRLHLRTGLPVSIEMADEESWGTRIVVGSVQTLREKRLKRFRPDRFSLIVTDEAHRSPAPSYRTIFNYFSKAKILGLTATADRLDGVAQGTVYDEVAFRKDIDEGISEGFLVPIVPIAAFIDSVNLGGIKTVAGDLAEGELEDEMVRSVAAIARKTFDLVGDRRTLVFTPGVGSAHKVCDALNEIRSGSARVVDGETPKDIRREILRAHRAGEFQFLINCLVFTEGYDDPGIQAIVNARPTKSRAMYVQIAGRGLRVLPGIGELATEDERTAAIAASLKPNCLLIDITGHPGRHNLIGPVDLLGGKFPPEVKERAKKILEKEGGDLTQVVEKARNQLVFEESERRRKADAKRAAEAEVNARTAEFELFRDNLRDQGIGLGDFKPEWLGQQLNERDREWLGSNKIPAKGLSHSDVLKLQRSAAMWRKINAATFAQRRLLAHLGIPVKHNMPRSVAETLIATLNAGPGPITKKQLDTVLTAGRDVGAEG